MKYIYGPRLYFHLTFIAAAMRSQYIKNETKTIYHKKVTGRGARGGRRWGCLGWRTWVGILEASPDGGLVASSSGNKIIIAQLHLTF